QIHTLVNFYLWGDLLKYDFAKIRYVSYEDDILESFYKPAVKNSVLYKRMAGYFSSSFIEEILEEINYSRYNNDFKIQIICSPELSEEDKESIKSGYEYKAKIENNISKILNDSESDIEELNEFTKLIINGVIDFRFAITKEGNGIFHAKEGIFYSDNNEKIGFTGSNNETKAALKYNFETTSVLKDNESITRMEKT